MVRADTLEKILMLGKFKGRRRRGWQKMRWLDGITDLMDMSLSKLQEIVKDRKTWHSIVHVVTKSRPWLSDWTELNWIVMLEKTLESSLDSKEIKPVNPKGNQTRIVIGRTDAEAEAPILWSPVAKSWLTGKDPDAGEDWGQGEKWVTVDEMAGWHPRLNGHEFENTQGDSEGQGSLESRASRTWWSN